MYLRITPVVRNLLLINVGLFLVEYMIELNFTKGFGLYYFHSSYFSPYQIVTHMFLHADWVHLLGNMIGIFFFGSLIENHWGSKKFLFFYMFCGLGAGLFFSGIQYAELKMEENKIKEYEANPNPDFFSEYILDNGKMGIYREYVDDFFMFPDDPKYQQETVEFMHKIYMQKVDFPMIGASGAVFGILMAVLLLFPNMTIYLYLILPVKAKYILIPYGVYELFSGIMRTPGDNVAHFAHVGGMLFAFILIKLLWKERVVN